jgi:hypothetical protein
MGDFIMTRTKNASMRHKLALLGDIGRYLQNATKKTVILVWF